MNELPTSPLERQLIAILAANREDSFATQRQRSIHVKEACRIVEAKFGLQKLANLGAKHVAAVVETWKAAHADKRVLENKLADLRWLVRKVGKANLMPRSNKDLGIQPAPRHTRAGKIVPPEKFESIVKSVQHPVIVAQIRLARAFGMRFEETALFRPNVDIQDDRVRIARGPKGGKSRFVMIRTRDQLIAIKAAKAVAVGGRGLIPEHFRTLKAFGDWVYAQLRAIGIGRSTDVVFHDLRRTYAVERVRQLVAAGRDPEAAADLVSRELGHHRREILEWYLGEGDLPVGGDALVVPIAEEWDEIRSELM